MVGAYRKGRGAANMKRALFCIFSAAILFSLSSCAEMMALLWTCTFNNHSTYVVGVHLVQPYEDSFVLQPGDDKSTDSGKRVVQVRYTYTPSDLVRAVETIDHGYTRQVDFY